MTSVKMSRYSSAFTLRGLPRPELPIFKLLRTSGIQSVLFEVLGREGLIQLGLTSKFTRKLIKIVAPGFFGAEKFHVFSHDFFEMELPEPITVCPNSSHQMTRIYTSRGLNPSKELLRKDNQIVILSIDTSGSMNRLMIDTPEKKKSRIEVTIEFIKAMFITIQKMNNLLKVIRVVLIEFNSTVKILGTFTPDQLLLEGCQGILNGLSAGGGTDYNGMLQTITDKIKGMRHEGLRYEYSVTILTDAEDIIPQKNLLVDMASSGVLINTGLITSSMLHPMFTPHCGPKHTLKDIKQYCASGTHIALDAVGKETANQWAEFVTQGLVAPSPCGQTQQYFLTKEDCEIARRKIKKNIEDVKTNHLPKMIREYNDKVKELETWKMKEIQAKNAMSDEAPSKKSRSSSNVMTTTQLTEKRDISMEIQYCEQNIVMHKERIQNARKIWEYLNRAYSSANLSKATIHYENITGMLIHQDATDDVSRYDSNIPSILIPETSRFAPKPYLYVVTTVNDYKGTHTMELTPRYVQHGIGFKEIIIAIQKKNNYIILIQEKLMDAKRKLEYLNDLILPTKQAIACIEFHLKFNALSSKQVVKIAARMDKFRRFVRKYLSNRKSPPVSPFVLPPPILRRGLILSSRRYSVHVWNARLIHIIESRLCINDIDGIKKKLAEEMENKKKSEEKIKKQEKILEEIPILIKNMKKFSSYICALFNKMGKRFSDRQFVLRNINTIERRIKEEKTIFEKSAKTASCRMHLDSRLRTLTKNRDELLHSISICFKDANDYFAQAIKEMDIDPINVTAIIFDEKAFTIHCGKIKKELDYDTFVPFQEISKFLKDVMVVEKKLTTKEDPYSYTSGELVCNRQHSAGMSAPIMRRAVTSSINDSLIW